MHSPSEPSRQYSTLRDSLVLFAVGVLLMGVMNYGGIRAPDSEVVFRTTIALAERGEFAIDEPLGWVGFGMAPGVDGGQYAVFGPLEAIVAVPFYELAKRIAPVERYRGPGHSLSLGVVDGTLEYLSDRPPSHPEQHALRYVMSWFNIIFAGLCMVVMYRLGLLLTQDRFASILVAVALGLATHLFNYAISFFSEVLATLLVMLSLYALLSLENADRFSRGIRMPMSLSGFALGLACATHITAILFSPFFAGYAWWRGYQLTNGDRRRASGTAGWFLSGLVVVIGLLGAYNYVRFGNPLETGRGIGDTAEFGYGVFTVPWEGLYGLLLSSGKGMLLYSPIVIFAALSWRDLHQRYRPLSYMIIVAALVRLLFIASRSDWHGGFCLGPRYLVMLLPLLMIPLVVAVHQWVKAGQLAKLHVAVVVVIVGTIEQLYFATGEIFSYLHAIKLKGLELEFNVFEDNFIYTNWTVSPFGHLLQGKRGPELLQWVPLSNHGLWLALALVVATAILVGYGYALRRWLPGRAM